MIRVSSVDELGSRPDQLDNSAGMALCARYVEPRFSNRVSRLPVEVAATIQSKPRGTQPICQRGGEGMMTARVFEEKQRPAGFQHAADFGQRPGRVGNAAKDERAKDGLECVCGEWQALRVGLRRRSARTAGTFECGRQHLAAFVQRKDARALAVVREIDARARADLEHRALRLRDQSATQARQPRQLERGERQVVRGSHSVKDAHPITTFRLTTV